MNKGKKDLLNSARSATKDGGGKILRDTNKILSIHFNQLIVDAHSKAGKKHGQ